MLTKIVLVIDSEQQRDKDGMRTFDTYLEEKSGKRKADIGF